MIRSLAIAVLCAACQPPPPPVSRDECLRPPVPEGTAVARVDSRPLVEAQIIDEIRAQGSVAVRRYTDPDEMRRFVEDQVRFQLLVQAALERGLQRDPDVIEAAHQVMVRKLLQTDMLQSEVLPPVPEAEIESYYQEHQDEYVQPEKRRYSQIQLPLTDQGRVQAEALIEDILAHPDDRQMFRSLQVEHSLAPPPPRRTGLLDLFHSRSDVEEDYGEAFAEVVFTAETDEVVPRPVQSRVGWHVVKVNSVRDPLTRGLDEVREEIRQQLQQGERTKLFEAYLAELKQRHPVMIYDARVESLAGRLAEVEP